MLHQKTEYSKLDAPFAEKKVDINTNDLVEILSTGQERPNKFDLNKTQTIIKVKTKNGARYVALNPKSINILIDEFGSNDDKTWIGKSAKVLLHPTIIGGKKVIIAYLVGMAWELDEYGEPVNPGVQTETQEDIPVIEIPEEGDSSEIGEPPF